MTSKKKRNYAISRNRRNAILASLLLLFAFLILLDRSYLSIRQQQKTQNASQLNIHDFQKYNEKSFAVVNVVDGDTIDIDIPDGQYDHTRIRLWGVDTPETKNPKTGVMYFGPEAAEFTKELTLGKEVTIFLEQTKDSRDKYGRLLAYVKLPDGKFLNELLLTEGYAYADLRFRHGFYYKYKQLEAVARSQKKGLWEEVTDEQMPQWRQRERALNSE